MCDIYSDIAGRLALAHAVQSASVDGVSIDLLGNSAAAILLATGAIASAGAFGATLQESDNGSTGWANVAAAQLQTNAPAVLAADSVYRFGYLGFKRYIRLSLTKAGGTSIAAGAVAVLAPDKRPVA